MKLQSEDKDGSEVMAEMDQLKPQVVDMATKTKKTSPKQEEEKWKNNKQEFENVIEIYLVKGRNITPVRRLWENIIQE